MVPSLEKSKRTTTLCHSSVFSLCPGSGTVFLLLLLLLLLPLAPVALSPPTRASPFCPPSFLLSFSLTAAAGVVLNSSHSRCLFARFNWKVLHAAHNAANDPRTVWYIHAFSYPDHLSSFRLRHSTRLETRFSQRVIVTELSLIIFSFSRDKFSAFR